MPDFPSIRKDIAKVWDEDTEKHKRTNTFGGFIQEIRQAARKILTGG